MIDVAIVGGGPAGLLAAARCAEAGLEVHVFEEHGRIGEPVHCTGIVSLETAGLAKIPDDLILARLTEARLVSPLAGVCTVRWDRAELEEVLVIDRAAFDRGLAADAQTHGAVIRTGARVESVQVRPCGVELGVAGERVAARACLLACGVSYRFQRQLGLGLPARVVHTAQVEVDAEASSFVELFVGRAVAPDGFLWTTPIRRDGRHRLKIGVLAGGDAGAYLERFLARPEIRARLKSPPERPWRRLLPLSPIARTYAERVLVVGDAGGFTKPTTGGGIFYSLLTATLAAQTLVEAFETGRLDSAFLSRYERRWRARIGQDLRVAGWLRHILTRCADRELDRLVRVLAVDNVQAAIRRSARFNWHRDVILALLRQPGIASVLSRPRRSRRDADGTDSS